MIYIYITYFFYLLIFTTLLKKVYTNRNSKVLSILCIFLFAIIDGAILTHKTPGKIWIVFILECIYYFLQFNTSIYKSVLNSIIFNFTTMVAEFFSTAISTYTIGLTMNTSIDSWQYVVLDIVTVLIASFIQRLIVQWLKVINKSKELIFIRVAILCLPMFTLYWAINLLNAMTILQKHMDLFFFLIILVLSNFILLYFYANSLTAQQLKIELLQAKQKEERMKDKYDLVCSQYEKNYKYLHDLIHTCSNLTRLVNTQNYSQLKEDISSLANKASETFNLLCSNSIPLNMVLNVYRNQFQDLNIAVNTTILSDFDFLSKEVEYELYDILIQTCIKCCKTSEKRFISISLKELNNKAYIKVMCPLLFDVTDLEKVCLENGLKLNVFKEEWTTLMICRI